MNKPRFIKLLVHLVMYCVNIPNPMIRSQRGCTIVFPSLRFFVIIIFCMTQHSLLGSSQSCNHYKNKHNCSFLVHLNTTLLSCTSFAPSNLCLQFSLFGSFVNNCQSNARSPFISSIFFDFPTLSSLFAV
jgi:hypothetical protein